MSAHPMLHGAGYSSGAFYERKMRNRRIVVEKCSAILISAADLAETIEYDGEVDPYRAVQLVEALIARIHDEAVGRMLGILPSTGDPQ